MSVIWYKVWDDLWSSKARTMGVILIIALGAAAIGVIAGGRALVTEGMAAIWRDSSPATIFLRAETPVDDGTVAALEEIEGVEGVEGYSSTTLYWRRPGDERWRLAELIARDDYGAQQYTRVERLSGAFPSGRSISLGQGVDVVYGLEEGEEIVLRLGEHEERVTISGVLYDPIARPPSFGGDAHFFTTRENMARLTGSDGFTHLLAGVPAAEQGRAPAIADAMQETLEARGVDSRGFLPPLGGRVADPQKHFFQDIIDGALLILGVLSLLALCLGLLLVFNTIEATITRQVQQIGILKALGASSGQVLRMYMVYVLAFGLFALLIALPAGIAGAWGLNVILLESYNAAPGPFGVAPIAIAAMVLLALLAPLIASLLPLRAALGVTVREAIGAYGLEARTGRLERAMARLGALPRLLLLTVGNTFRHRRRALLTQVTLVLSGLIFMVVVGVRESSFHTFEEVVRQNSRYDVYLLFQEPQGIENVEALTREVEGVEEVEMWYRGNALIRPAGAEETPGDPEIAIFGLPLPTSLYAPTLKEGRWLTEGEAGVVLNEQVARKTGLTVGDHVTIDSGVRGETEWQVIGLVEDPYFVTGAYLSRELFLAQAGASGTSDRIYVRTTRHDPAGQSEAEARLRAFYEEQGLALVPAGGTLSALISEALGTLTLIITLLALMALIVGVVGSLALGGVLSLNVLDRRREIGVMRALGATGNDIRAMLVGEGLILSWISWIIALPLALPLGWLMVELLSSTIQVGLVYRYTLLGTVLWFIIVTLLALAASYLPARQALHTSVRESLAYY